MSAPNAWLAAGLACVAAGLGLAIAAAVEIGIVLVVVGAGLLATGAAALLRPPPAADRTPLQSLDRRLAELRQLEDRLLAGGISPSERAYHELRLARAAAEGAPDAAGAADLVDDDERRLAELIARRCDRVWEGIRERRYVRSEGGRVTDLDGGALFAEVREIVQEVAGLYHADSDNAVLEVRTGDLALAVRSAIGDLLHLVSQVPYVDPAGWSVRSVVERLEQVQKGLALYDKLTPYQHYVNAASVATRLALGSNPITIAAWTVGTEVARRVGGKVIKSYAETWLKELLETSVALVYVHVARTYDPRRAYRSADWTALVEALRVHARIPGTDHNRKLLLDRILGAQIPDEFAKMTLLRALAGDRVPDSGSVPATDLAALRPAERKAVADRLSGLLSAMQGLHAAEASEAVDDLERRLQVALRIDLPGAGDPTDARVTEGFARLVALARDRLGLARDEARHAVAATPFATRARKSVGAAAVRRTLDAALAAIYGDGNAATGESRPLDPPRELVGDVLAGPFVESLVDLLATVRSGWPIEHDRTVQLHTSVLLPGRREAQALWQRHLAAASTRLRALLECPDASAWPPRSAPAIVRQVGAVNRPAVAVFEATTSDSRSKWLLVFADHLVVGNVADDALAIDDGEPENHPIGAVRLFRDRGWVADALVIGCGHHRLTIAGRIRRSFEASFGSVLERLGRRADQIEPEP